ncbi:uncharacterized protein EKO05_0005431 [Ascochyta rabiei]|uniref:Uncharacterized protein n=1 Tax=Didymella rabiei TaxID=5454 RepID=A0A163JPG9_DIDRA|nr:uncharacterized protein EKO05_0005431 [Ascochyta rabiei]KZM26492.1 hypothetical protein ST47_g2288 [Ascochyta rabiei]UPX14963.1 hypothetical protein EKO05_0005431 [Ascochyta rabiei]
MSIHLTPTHASALPSDLRNSIYSALLSSGGIRNIEATLTQLLQTSGFQASLRAYITELFRTGQATTANEAYALAMERVRESMAEGESEGEGSKASAVNGGAYGNGEDEATETLHLRLPRDVVRDGTRCVRRELEKVVQIDVE